jgi:penicillin-binding protein 1A
LSDVKRALVWLLRLFVWGIALGVVLGVLTVVGVYLWLAPNLPDVASIRDVRVQVPLRVYSAEGKLIAEFGEIRRRPVTLAEVPKDLVNAFIAIEDARFYAHPGVDVRGVSRAGWEWLSTGKSQTGASTITMQLPRNYEMLGRERRVERKLREMILAIKLEREMSKDEILALYLNKIELGYRAHGVAAAAQVYYGKELKDLTLAESAMIAGLPKAPSTMNPIRNPARALERRNYILQRMRDLGHITQAQYVAAVAEADQAYLHEPTVELNAPYVAEIVRAQMIQKFGAEETYSRGFQVYTTVQSDRQNGAQTALTNALRAYDERHGFRGAEATLDLTTAASPEAQRALLGPWRPIAGFVPALVMQVYPDGIDALLKDGQTVKVPFTTMRWAQRYLTENYRGTAPNKPSDLVKPGAVVRLRMADDGSYAFSQLPRVQGAIVALDTDSGAVRALVGGLSFGLSKFNRATQMQRQPGSSFKPFVYSAAFQKGFTAASIVNDAPVVFSEAGMDKPWRPENDSGRFYGPTRLREAMVYSRNLVSVRVLQSIGINYARRYIRQFGLSDAELPPNLSMALGTGAVPPLKMAQGYAAFANGGFRVEPYYIEKILERDGTPLFVAQPGRACNGCPERIAADIQALIPDLSDSPEPAVAAAPPASAEAEVTAATNLLAPDAIKGPALAPRAIDSRNAFIMRSLMRDVVKRGTATAALVLNRADIAGKTGTTNDHRDAWFSGYTPDLAAAAWVGFDDFSPLGAGEFGGKAALPMWIEFMRGALAELPQREELPPPGLTTADINPGSGLIARPGSASAISEVFMQEHVPAAESAAAAGAPIDPNQGGAADPFSF